MSGIIDYLLIYLVSLFFNWLVQLSYYLSVTRKKPQAFEGYKTLFDYYTGIIGDGIIVPLINILIYIFILNSGYQPSILTIVEALTIGITLDVAFHYAQARLELVNWSMPGRFQWNFAGRWHMISFPIQISYLALFVFALRTHWGLMLSNPALKTATIGISGLCLLFLFLFAIDYELV